MTRNPRVDHVDYPADRGGAEEQSGWAAKHLDPFRGDRIDGNGMVGPRRRKVEAADAVGEHAHPVARQAAENRRGCGRAEARRADARLTGEGLANARPDLTREIGRIENGDAAEDVLGSAPDSSDDDFAVVVSMFVMRFFRGARSRGGRSSGKRSVCRVDRCVSGESGEGNTGNRGREGQARSEHQFQSVTNRFGAYRA